MLQKIISSDIIEEKLILLNKDLHMPWEIIEGKLYKEFKFLNFREAFAFMTHVATHATELNHHPEWSNNFRIVDVYLITHITAGHEGSALTELDFSLAAKMNETAKAISKVKDSY